MPSRIPEVEMLRTLVGVPVTLGAIALMAATHGVSPARGSGDVFIPIQIIVR